MGPCKTGAIPTRKREMLTAAGFWVKDYVCESHQLTAKRRYDVRVVCAHYGAGVAVILSQVL